MRTTKSGKPCFLERISERPRKAKCKLIKGGEIERVAVDGESIGVEIVDVVQYFVQHASAANWG